MFSRRLSAGDLAALCRALRHYLAAGMTLVRVLRQQAERGPRGVRPLAARLAARLEAGTSLGDALDSEQEVLPPLFLAMAKLGEESGHLPEIMGALEEYFQMQMQLRRQFLSRAFLPVAQLVLGILVIAALIFILGLLAGNGTPSLTFFGLRGGAGSLALLGTAGGIAILGWVLYKAAARWARQRAAVDRALLRVPVVGPCLEAFALARFTVALQLTLDSGMSIAKALRLSLRATGNAAYAAAADGVARVLKAGRTLHEALMQSGMFGEELLNIIASAEEVGSVPEAMRQQAQHYHEEAGRRLAALTGAANALVWLVYAGFMVWMIFRIFVGSYLKALGG